MKFVEELPRWASEKYFYEICRRVAEMSKSKVWILKSMNIDNRRKVLLWILKTFVEKWAGREYFFKNHIDQFHREHRRKKEIWKVVQRWAGGNSINPWGFTIKKISPPVSADLVGHVNFKKKKIRISIMPCRVNRAGEQAPYSDERRW